jgi:hypothetical protein
MKFKDTSNDEKMRKVESSSDSHCKETLTDRELT